MNSFTTAHIYRTARHADSGARPPVWDRAGVEKYATGPRTRLNSRKSWKYQICRYFLKHRCKFGIRCRNPHSRGSINPKKMQDETTDGHSDSERVIKSNPNHNQLQTGITTRNRFDLLHDLEVGQDLVDNQEILPITVDSITRRKNDNVNLNKAFKSSHKNSSRNHKNQNPSGDIWDQKSLNLNTLFRSDEKSHLKIGIWNAESVRGKENLTKQYILDNDLDVLIVQESWLEKDELPSTASIIPDSEVYKLHQLPRPNRKNASGGGMLCIYRQNIEIAKIPAIKTKVLEVMDLKLTLKNKNVRIVAVYRPPRSKKRLYPISDFYEDMENLPSHYKSVKEEVIFCGDYNVHYNKQYESETRRFMSIIESANLKQYVNGKTHVKGNTLDLIMTESDSDLILNHAIDEFLSDHAMILVDLNLEKPPKSKRTISFRKNKEIDLEKLKSRIDENLEKNGEINDLNEMVKKFNQALNDAYNEQAPLITKTIIIRPPTPWSNEDIRKDKATRRNLERKWRRTGLQIDWEIYRDFRNKFNAKLNDFRNKQYSEMIENNKNDPTTLFRVINKSLHRNQPSPMPSGLSNSQLAEKFSNFFAEKIDKIRNGIDSNLSDQSEGSNSQSNVTHKLSEFTPLSENEVEKIIKDFPNKQCGLDPLPLSLLKECLPIVLKHITRIVNLSLNLGDLPESLKLAIIRPLLKKLGLELELKNYRPVSNLSFLSKLIEKIVAGQFIDHMIRNKLLDPLQSAYKKHHSTETALLKVQNDILIDLDQKNVTILVLLDLSAAFDTIDHDILLSRLNKSYGIEGTALNWFRSFLTNRSQSVIIDDEVSKPKPLKYGVPQGSVLGPLLFTAYMTPLRDVINKYGLKYHCYADDTQLYISFSPTSSEEENRSIESLETAVKDIKNFMISNKLKLNDEKTEVIFLGTKVKLNQVKSTDITVGGSKISPTDKVKNLGIVFDKNLTMDHQVIAICKSGFYHVKNLRKIRKFLNAEHANIAAHAFVTSKLDYGNSLLAGAPKYQVKKLQTVQNAAARVVTKTGKYDHITAKLKELKWLPVTHRIKFKINLLTWKAIKGTSPEYIAGMITKKDFGRELRFRDTNLLYVPKSNLKSMGDKAFSSVAPKLWNALPRSLRLNGSLQSFKAGLRSLFLDEAYSGLD